MAKFAAFWVRHLVLSYVIAMVLMVAGLAVIFYFNQEYRSPTYQTSLADCVKGSAWMAAIDGAGVLAPVTFSFSGQGPSVLMSPILGLAVYFVFGAVLSRAGRNWAPGWHVFIGVCWLFIGAIIMMMGIHK